jgi:hypothetical protein
LLILSYECLDELSFVRKSKKNKLNEDYSRTATMRYECRARQTQSHCSFYGLRGDIIEDLELKKKYQWPDLSQKVNMLEKKRTQEEKVETVQSLSTLHFPKFVAHLEELISTEERRSIDYFDSFSSSHKFSNGCNPNISHPIHNNLTTTSTVVCVGDNKKRRQKPQFSAEEKELVISYAEKWLSGEPYRLHMIVYLTDLHFIQFFRIDNDQTIYESEIMQMRGIVFFFFFFFFVEKMCFYEKFHFIYILIIFLFL